MNRKEFGELVALGMRAPIGVAFLGNNVPQGVEKPRRPCTFCEDVVKARGGSTIGLIKDDLDCPYALAVLGFEEMSKDVVESLVKHQKFGPNTQKFLEALPMLPSGKYRAVVVGPLDSIPIEPDVDIITGSADQIIRVLHAWVWLKGEYLKPHISGLASICSEAIAYVSNSGLPNLVSLPCLGAKEVASFPLGDVIFALPHKLMPDIIRALSRMSEVIKPKEIDEYVLNLLREKGKISTRAVTKELVNSLILQCPDRPAGILVKLYHEGKIGREFSKEEGGFVWWVK